MTIFWRYFSFFFKGRKHMSQELGFRQCLKFLATLALSPVVISEGCIFSSEELCSISFRVQELLFFFFSLRSTQLFSWEAKLFSFGKVGGVNLFSQKNGYVSRWLQNTRNCIKLFNYKGSLKTNEKTPFSCKKQRISWNIKEKIYRFFSFSF